jgi:hypothetical protein
MGIIVLGISSSGLAQPPQARGRPADAGPPSFVQFPAPKFSVGVIHAQPPALPAPTVAAPAVPAAAAASSAAAKLSTPAGGAGRAGDRTGNGSSDGKAGARDSGYASRSGDENASNGATISSGNESGYSLQAALPVEPGSFPRIQRSVPVPDCVAR